MADVFEEITQNLETSFDGQSITYNGVSKTITCERERHVNIIDNRFPFLKLSGPIIEVLRRERNRVYCSLHYMIEFIDDSINDKYDPDVVVNPIGEVLGTVEVDLMKIAMSNPTRGGYAKKTEWEGSGYYFDDDEGVSLFVKYVELAVETNVIAENPYITGG